MVRNMLVAAMISAPTMLLVGAPSEVPQPDAGTTPTLGDVDCHVGESDCNRCAVDPLGDFAALTPRDPLATVDARERSDARHHPGTQPPLTALQGVEGLARMHGGTLVFSRSADWTTAGHAAGVFATTLDGGAAGYVTTADDTHLSTVVDTPVGTYGGLASLGHTVLVAGQCAEPGCGAPARVDMFDLTDPSAPTLVGRFAPQEDEPGYVGAVRLADGHHLALTGGGGVYRTDTAGLGPDTTWSHVATWTPPAEATALTLATECDSGRIYGISTGAGDATLLSLDVSEGHLEARREALRHLPCGDVPCPALVAGAWVGPRGHLNLFTTGRRADGHGRLHIDRLAGAPSAGLVAGGADISTVIQPAP